MYSGSRNTMRDNTLLSAAYIKTAQQIILEDTGENIDIQQKWLCGDDADLFFIKRKHFLLFQKFMSTHWAINPAKQTVGRYLHEFLQREGEADGTIR